MLPAARLDVDLLPGQADHADLGWGAASGDAAIWATLDLLALRVPVLVERDSVAAPYVANNITGLLLAPGDAPAAAAAIARILAHEDDREAMGDAAYARVAREFSDAEMVDAFERAAQAAADRSLWVA